MPEYALQCHNCDTKYAFERSIHAHGDWPKCPTCDSTDIKRIFTPPAISFKGGGWGKDKKQ